MLTGANLLDAVIKSSDKVKACDFSHLNNHVKQEAPAQQSQKNASPLMIKKKKAQQGESRVNYTFAL